MRLSRVGIRSRQVPLLAAMLSMAGALLVATIPAAADSVGERVYDRETGRIHWHLTTPVKLASAEAFRSGRVYLDLFRTERDDQPGRVTYNIQIICLAERWMIIERGETLELRVEGSMVPFDGAGSENRRDLSGGTWSRKRGERREVAFYPVTPDVLRRLAAQGEIAGQLLADVGTISLRSSQSDFKRVRKWIRKYVK